MIICVNEDNFEKVKDFLSSVPSIEKIDDDVLKNGVAIIEDEVNGVVSFEKFNTYGLIRYFVFQKGITPNLIEELFLKLEENARKENIDFVFSIILNDDIKSLFEGLNFASADKDFFFIDEDNVKDTRYKDALIMIKKIVS